jgi:hypothetical protein
MRTAVLHLLLLTGAAGLCMAKNEPGKSGNAYGHTDNSGLHKGQSKKVYSVPETINSGVTIGALILLYGGGLFVRSRQRKLVRDLQR